jgi:hypothetical protein
MKKIYSILMICMLILNSCGKDCNTAIQPGFYTDECACPNGGYNFHGKCFDLKVYDIYLYKLTQNCEVDILFAYDFTRNLAISHSYYYVARSDNNNFHEGILGPIVYENGQNEFSCDEISGTSNKVIDGYSYFPPKKGEEFIRARRYANLPDGTWLLDDSISIHKIKP